MPVTFYPIQDGFDFVAVVLLGQKVVRGPIGLVWVGGSGRVCAAVDLGSKEIVNAFSRWPGQYFMSGMLVRPGGQKMVLVGDLKNRIHMKILVGVDRSACVPIDGQLCGSDDLCRIACHLEDVSPRITTWSWHYALAGVEGSQVQVERFEVSNFSSRRIARAGSRASREHVMIP